MNTSRQNPRIVPVNPKFQPRMRRRVEGSDDSTDASSYSKWMKDRPSADNMRVVHPSCNATPANDIAVAGATTVTATVTFMDIVNPAASPATQLEHHEASESQMSCSMMDDENDSRPLLPFGNEDQFQRNLASQTPHGYHSGKGVMHSIKRTFNQATNFPWRCGSNAERDVLSMREMISADSEADAARQDMQRSQTDRTPHMNKKKPKSFAKAKRGIRSVGCGVKRVLKRACGKPKHKGHFPTADGAFPTSSSNHKVHSFI